MGKIIAFTNQKGGVGKTTTCVNVSAYLAAMGKKVLLVDIDPQGNASSGLGIEKKKIKKSIYHCLTGDCEPEEAIMETGVNNLSIIPSNIDLAGAEIDLVRISGRERIIRKYLEKVRGSYDYICIDCPPSLGLLTVNALTASDAIIIPIQCEFFALEGVSQLVNTVRQIRKQNLNPDLDIDGVLLTMFDKRSTLTELVANEILKFFGNKVFKTRIPRNVRLAEAPAHGKPITVFDRKCTGAIAYQKLAEEFLTRQPKL